jgi:hypothetical protein
MKKRLFKQAQWYNTKIVKRNREPIPSTDTPEKDPALPIQGPTGPAGPVGVPEPKPQVFNCWDLLSDSNSVKPEVRAQLEEVWRILYPSVRGKSKLTPVQLIKNNFSSNYLRYLLFLSATCKAYLFSDLKEYKPRNLSIKNGPFSSSEKDKTYKIEFHAFLVKLHDELDKIAIKSKTEEGKETPWQKWKDQSIK